MKKLKTKKVDGFEYMYIHMYKKIKITNFFRVPQRVATTTRRGVKKLTSYLKDETNKKKTVYILKTLKQKHLLKNFVRYENINKF